MYSSTKGLSLPQFAAFLRLVAAAQQGLDLWSPTLVSSVLYPPTSQERFGLLPVPRLSGSALDRPSPSPSAGPSPSPLLSPKPPRCACWI